MFFGEDLPERFHRLVKPDFSACDLLLVMGTSLAVNPFASLVAHVPSQVQSNITFFSTLDSGRAVLTLQLDSLRSNLSPTREWSYWLRLRPERGAAQLAKWSYVRFASQSPRNSPFWLVCVCRHTTVPTRVGEPREGGRGACQPAP